MAKESCHNCVYGWRDLSRAIADFAIGFPSRPTCANQPGHYGQPKPTPLGKVCPNHRPRPPEPTGENVKRIILTNGMVAYVDAADYEELSQYTWHFASGGYACRFEQRRLIMMHRQIMNPPEGMQVDHIHRNRLDNTRAHLRVCTALENARNRAKRADATSRYIGVWYDKKRKRWITKIRVEGAQRPIGSFADDREAARAYDHAAVLYLDDFARLNFPEEWPPQRRAEVRAQQDAAFAGANHDSPSSRTQDHGHGRGTEDRGQRTDRPARPRATGHEPRTTKKGPRAETQGRRGGKPKAKKSKSEEKKGKRRRATGP